MKTNRLVISCWVLGATLATPLAVAQTPPTTPTTPTPATPVTPVTPVVTDPGAQTQPLQPAQPAVVAAPTGPGAVVIPAAQTAAQAGRLVSIREIDREVSTLSNDIGLTYARLQQITAMVLQESGGGALLVVEHQNDMGSTFRLMRATYSLDGATIATRTDESGSLADQQRFSVYNGRVTSGEHSLTVNLEYQGNGYGIFSYIRGYTFRARSVRTFTVPEGQALRITVVGYERGGATTAVEERPAIRYTQATMTLQEARAQEQREQAQQAQPVQGASTPAGVGQPPAQVAQ